MAFTLDEALMRAADFLGVAFFELKQKYDEAASGFEAARKAIVATKGKNKSIYSFYSPSVNPRRDTDKLNSLAMLEGKTVLLTFFNEHPINDSKACQLDGYGRKFGALVYIDRAGKGRDEGNLKEMTRLCIKKNFSAKMQQKHTPRVLQIPVSR